MVHSKLLAQFADFDTILFCSGVVVITVAFLFIVGLILVLCSFISRKYRFASCEIDPVTFEGETFDYKGRSYDKEEYIIKRMDKIFRKFWRGGADPYAAWMYAENLKRKIDADYYNKDKILMELDIIACERMIEKDRNGEII